MNELGADNEQHIDLAASDDDEEETGVDPKSPPKKKSRAERKQEKKAVKKAAKAAAKEAEKGAKEASGGKAAKGTSEPPVSILKTGQVSAGVRVAAARKNHIHKFHRQIVETSIVLDAPGGRKARIAQFTKAIRSLVENCQLVDPHFQIDPRDVPSTKDPIFTQEGVSDNHAVLSFHIRTSGGSESFDMQKPRKNDKKKGERRQNQNAMDSDDEEQDLVFPQVYFNFACSSDMDPQELFECVGVEWGRHGGARVYLKAFNTFETDTCLMVLKSWNRLSGDTFIGEFKMMFKEAKELMAQQAMEQQGHDITEAGYVDYCLPSPR
jgi:hypothetical protein